MPFGAVKLVPGLNAERTPTLLEAGYAQTSRIRFRDQMAEKLGGWKKYINLTTDGVPKALHAWLDLNDVARLAEATNFELNVIENGTLTEITPIQFLDDTVPNFSTTNGSTTVQISDPLGPSPITTYMSVFFNTPVSVGGIILSGLYPITNVAGLTTYTIEAATPATATVVGGGAVPTFQSTSGSAEVVVTLANHGMSIGDTAVFQIPTTVGGIVIEGSYSAVSIPGANQFTIVGNVQASSSGTIPMNGGNVEFVYYVALGPAAAGTGYGFGPYGAGPYGGGGGGTPVVPPGSVRISCPDWSLDNWGKILLSCPFGGGIYQFDPQAETGKAQIVATGPPFNGGMFVSMASQILVCWGSSIVQAIGVERDPLLVRWSTSGDFTNFVENSFTLAGTFRIPIGSKIVGGMQASHQGLIWTDIDLWVMSYIQPPLVFGFNKVGAGCGLIGQHAAAELRGAVYWIGTNNIFVLAGQGVEVVPCPVWDVLFQDLDTANQSKCWALPNSPFNEVWFFYPSRSGGTGECDKYIKLNILERAWDTGPLNRSCGIDVSILGPPILGSPASLIFQHEVGFDADQTPMAWSYTTGYFYISEGEDFTFVDQIFPDFRWGLYNGSNNAHISIVINVVNYPGDTPVSFGPYTVSQATQFIATRLRGRQMSFTVSGNDLGSFSRLGKVRYRYAPDGRN